MTSKEFQVFFNFIGNDSIVYFLLVRDIAGFNIDETRLSLLQEITNHTNKYIPVNISIQPNSKTVTLQCLQKSRRCNAIAIKHTTLLPIVESLGYSLDELIGRSILFFKMLSSCKAQRRRKKPERKVQKSLCTVNAFDEWIDKNQEKLLSRCTQSEQVLFKDIKKAFKSRASKQHPFVIGSKVYYADICLKSLNVIIEVDGGYHTEDLQRQKDAVRDKAFSSIGYETIRCTNDQVSSPEFRRSLVQRLKNKQNTLK